MNPKFSLAVLLLSATLVSASDWPQFRGPSLNSTTPDTVQPWASEGPRRLWQTPCDSGFSSFAVSSGAAFTLIAKPMDGEEHETCLALDATTGKILWQQDLGKATYFKRDGEGSGNDGASGNRGGDGPRSTPSIDGDRVYVSTASLVVFCLDARTGKPVWQRDLIKEHNGKNIKWNSAASPVIDENLIFVAGGGPGEALLALDKKDGHVVWKGEDDLITHSTPTIATLHGVKQVIFFTQKGLVALETKTGKLLWRYPFEFRVSTAMTPVVGGEIVYCSAGYNVGADACRISKSGDTFTATQLWHKPANTLNSHWSTPVYRDGYLYGLFGFKEYGAAPLKCIELATGKEIWSQPGFGPGGVILAGDRLVVLGDSGQLVLVQPSPKGYVELARAKVVDGKCWSTPVVSNGRIYVRSTKFGVCLEAK